MIIRVIRDEHTYVFNFDLYKLEQVSRVRRLVGWFAANSECNFTWHDAANVCRVINNALWKAEQHGQQSL